MIPSTSNCLTSTVMKDWSVSLNHLLLVAIGFTFGSRSLNSR